MTEILKVALEMAIDMYEVGGMSQEQFDEIKNLCGMKLLTIEEMKTYLKENRDERK